MHAEVKYEVEKEMFNFHPARTKVELMRENESGLN